MTCQAHPVLVKKANQMCGSFLLKFLSRWLSSLLIVKCLGLVHLWTDQRIPGPVSCRCPNGSLETPPRWHATISIFMQSDKTSIYCSTFCSNGCTNWDLNMNWNSYSSWFHFVQIQEQLHLRWNLDPLSHLTAEPGHATPMIPLQ